MPTVSRKAYLAYRTGVSSLHILGSPCKNVDMLPVITHEQNMRLDLGLYYCVERALCFHMVPILIFATNGPFSHRQSSKSDFDCGF